MTKHSRQYHAAVALWERERDKIQAAIVRSAEYIVSNRIDLTSQQAYNEIFADGVFYPFWNAPTGKIYEKVIERLGNEDDEVLFLSQTWRMVLTLTNEPRYRAIIAKLKEIEEHGL